MSLTKKQKQVLKNILAGNVEDIKKELQNIIDELDLRILEETDSCAKDIKFRIKSIIREDYYDGSNMYEKAYDNIYVEYNLDNKKRYKFDVKFSYEIICHGHSGGVEEIHVKFDSIKGNIINYDDCLLMILSEIIEGYSCVKKHLRGYNMDEIYEQIKKYGKDKY
jgi:hypothetical protein